MKGRWKKAWLLLLLAGIFGGGTVVWSAFSDSVSVKNRITLGDVNIRLSEKELKEGKEIAYQDPKLIFPGDTISKIPMVTNLAEDCWIRARICFRQDEGDIEGFTDQDLGGFSSKWVRQGEYYYYREVLKSGESVDLFHTVKVPESWTELHAKQNLSIDIRTDAIQAKNFTPDFDALSPWGNHPIELCIHAESGKKTVKKEQTENIVEFNGVAHRLLAVPDDFFAGFGTAMPGDQLSGAAQLANTTKKTAELFFHTEAGQKGGIHDDLLQKLQLTVSMDGKKLYEGPLKAEKLSKDISLIRLSPGQKGRMDFTVRIPDELNNTYALEQTDVKWVFTVRENEITDPPGADPEPESNPQEYREVRSFPVKTGDASASGMWLGLLFLSFAVLLFGMAAQRGGKKE